MSGSNCGQCRGAQHFALGQQLARNQRRRGRADVGQSVRLLVHGEVLGAADDVERSLETGEHQFVAGFVVVIEGALGDVEQPRNAIDRGAAITLLIDELGSRAQKRILRQAGGLRKRSGHFRRARLDLMCGVGRESVEQDVAQPRRRPRIIIDDVPVDPDYRP